MTMKDKILLITGASYGIGAAIARRAARDGASIALLARSISESHALVGEIKKLGGNPLPIKTDVASDEQLQNAIDLTAKTFGRIDVLVNNASVTLLRNTQGTPIKDHDLMLTVNARGTFLASKMSIPHLSKSQNPHILNISPPLKMNAKWFLPHLPYTISKYAMSMCVLGLSQELKPKSIAVNALWPRSGVATETTKRIMGESKYQSMCRDPAIMADAAAVIFAKSSKDAKNTGNFYIDDLVLKDHGDKDLGKYNLVEKPKLMLDFFLDGWEDDGKSSSTLKASSDKKPAQSMMELFKTLEAGIDAHLVKMFNTIFAFKFTDVPGKPVWLIDLKNGNGAMRLVEETELQIGNNLEALFTCTTEMFMRVFRGDIKLFYAIIDDNSQFSFQGDHVCITYVSALIEHFKRHHH